MEKSRAAAIALSVAGATVTITGRNLKSAAALAKIIKAETLTIAEAEERHFDVLINATPVGMHPKPDAMLFRENVPADVVLDMVYNPHETLLLKCAKAQGRTIVYGAEMLLDSSRAAAPPCVT